MDVLPSLSSMFISSGSSCELIEVVMINVRACVHVMRVNITCSCAHFIMI